jgi:hypothetical protein
MKALAHLGQTRLISKALGLLDAAQIVQVLQLREQSLSETRTFFCLSLLRK